MIRPSRRRRCDAPSRARKSPTRSSRYRPEVQALERCALLAILPVPSVQYPTITAAVNHANNDNGDIIEIQPGTYDENSIDITAPMTLESVNTSPGNPVIIDGGGLSASATAAETMAVTNVTGPVTIQGITFQDPPAIDTNQVISSLFITGNSGKVTVSNNIFTGLGAVAADQFDYGAYAYQTKATGLVDFEGNQFTEMWYGLVLEVPLGGRPSRATRSRAWWPRTLAECRLSPWA